MWMISKSFMKQMIKTEKVGKWMDAGKKYFLKNTSIPMENANCGKSYQDTHFMEMPNNSQS